MNGKRNNWNKIREKIAREKQRALKEKIAQNLRDGARRKSHDKANRLPARSEFRLFVRCCCLNALSFTSLKVGSVPENHSNE